MRRVSWAVAAATAVSLGMSQGAVAEGGSSGNGASEVPVEGHTLGTASPAPGMKEAGRYAYAVHSVHRVDGATVLYFSVKSLKDANGEVSVHRRSTNTTGGVPTEGTGTVGAVKLLDLEGGRAYRVLSESESGDCLCTDYSDVEEEDAEKWQVMYATFPELPASVETVSVDVNGSGSVVHEVPVSDGELPEPQVEESSVLTGEGWPKAPTAASVRGKDFFSREPVWSLASVFGRLDETLRRAELGDQQTLQVNADVLFEYGKADITPKADKALDEVAERLKDAKVTRADVVGHTDDKGDTAFNQTLSEDRAVAVEEELSKRLKGVEMKTSGKGESEPVADNETEEGQALNRRVEIRFEAEEK